MKIFLAGWEWCSYIVPLLANLPTKVLLLGSYFYLKDRLKDGKRIDQIIDYAEDFILDSGAYTYMNSKKSISINEVESYLDGYAAFIKKHNIKNFIEFDIDSVIGYKKVKKLRCELESKVGRLCIPAWHRNRGEHDFYATIKQYPYVALGTLKTILPSERGIFNTFVREGQKQGCKIHLLGFTLTTELHKWHVESVDSSTWIKDGAFGRYSLFNGRRIITTKWDKEKGVSSRVKVFNFIEWYKYQRWALTHL